MSETVLSQPIRHKSLLRDIVWFRRVLDLRLDALVRSDETTGGNLPPPPLLSVEGADPYARTLTELSCTPAERLVLVLALIPQVMPSLLDPLLVRNEALGTHFTEFGGFIEASGGFRPTLETALFLLAGGDIESRLACYPLFSPAHFFAAKGVLIYDVRAGDAPRMAAGLRLSPEYCDILLGGGADAPEAGTDFPAAHITTPLEWADLVLDDATQAQVGMILRWVRHGGMLMTDWGLRRRLKPGYRSLFYGPPGTGKTLTACLIGKSVGQPVFRIDLSRVVSKWIGETEKNLGNLFDRAQYRNWILFFDEAEALFGRRTESRDANDRSANQQISYLLQRLEDFPGVVVLATNQRAYMDEAFTRRFQSTIPFPMPDAAARLRLWKDNFLDPRIPLAPDVDFDVLAEKYELAGGSIVNILRTVCLLAADRSPPLVTAADLMAAVRQELRKEGKYLR